MPFIGKQSTSNSQITNYTTTVGSGGQTNFTVVIEGGDETHVYLNGVLLKETTDYTVSSTQVSLVSPAVENDIVEIKVFRSFALADAVKATGGTFSGDVTVPNLTLSSNVIKASDGGSSLTLDTSDNLTVAGSIQVGGNVIKASDGGSTITLDTSDNVTIAGDLKVGAIKASNGTSGITIASDGQITVNQNNPTVTLGSNTTFPSGIIKNATVFTNNNRTQINTSSDLDREAIDLGDYNKLSSSTKLLISVFVPVHGPNHSGVRGIGIKYGSASTVWCGAYYYTGTSGAYGGFCEAHLYLASHTTTGSQAISLREGCANGTDTGRAFATINPNSTDEPRYYQTFSTVKIYEII